MGPEPAKEKKSKDGKKEQESEPPHLYKTELDTLAVANRRVEFLNAAMKIPEARAKLTLLFDETMPPYTRPRVARAGTGCQCRRAARLEAAATAPYKNARWNCKAKPH